MYCVYVGDSKKNIIGRILTNHCSGNVEGSGLREAVAQKMGFKLIRIKRPSGSYRVRIDLPIPKEGETKVSDYIRSGSWRYVIYHEQSWLIS